MSGTLWSSSFAACPTKSSVFLDKCTSGVFIEHTTLPITSVYWTWFETNDGLMAASDSFPHNASLGDLHLAQGLYTGGNLQGSTRTSQSGSLSL